MQTWNRSTKYYIHTHIGENTSLDYSYTFYFYSNYNLALLQNSLSYLFHPATIKLPWQHMRIIQALMCQGEHKRALRYIQMMKPSMISSTEVALHITVLLYNR